MRFFAVILGILLFPFWQARGAELFTLSPANYEATGPNGKSTVAFYGDYVLRNDAITVIVADPALQMGRSASRLSSFRLDGGIIVLVRNDAPTDAPLCFQPLIRNRKSGIWVDRPEDQEVHPHLQRNFIDPAETWRRPERAPQTAPHVRLSLPLRPPGVAVHYSLADGWDYVQVEVEIRAPAAEPYSTPASSLAQALNLGGRFTGSVNDMLWGNGGDPRYAWVYDPWSGGAIGLWSDPEVSTYLPASGGQGLHRHLRAADGTVTVAAGEHLLWRSMAWPATDGFAAARVARRFHGQPMREVPLQVLAGGAPEADVMVLALADDKLLAAGRTDRAGRLALYLPSESEVTLQLRPFGRPEQVHEIPPGTVDVQKIQFAAAARVLVEVHDQDDRPIPAKVAFVGLDGAPNPDFGPPTGDQAVGNLRYTVTGTFRQILAPGSYRLTASRGPEYEMAEQEIIVAPEQESPVRFRLARVVDTSGWISADFGSISSVSRHATTASISGRIHNLLAEHVEFAPAAEYDFVFDYQPWVERLNAGAWLRTAPGIHLTQRARWGYNDQISFPLRHVPGAQDGGATQRPQHVPQVYWLHTWYSGLTPRGRANWESDHEKLIIVTPPGIWPKDGRSDGMHRLFWPTTNVRENPYLEGRLSELQAYHAMAIQPLDVFFSVPEWRAEDPRGEADQQDWWDDLRDRMGKKWPVGADRQKEYFRILREGFRIPGVAMSSSDDNFHGNSAYRTWVRSATDKPAELDPLAIVRAIKLGQTIMSTGPFLDVTARAGAASAGPGDDLAAPGGDVTLQIAARAPSWMRIERVAVLVNGLRLAAHDYRRDTHPESFPRGTTQFQQTFGLQLPVDSFVAVLLQGTSRNLRGGTAESRDEYAMISPLYVDVDGNGFKPHNPVDDLVFTFLDPLTLVSRGPDADPSTLRLYLRNDADEPAVVKGRVEVRPAAAGRLSEDGAWSFTIPPGGEVRKDFSFHLAADYEGEEVSFFLPRSTDGVGTRRAGARVTIGRHETSWTDEKPTERTNRTWHRNEIRDQARPPRWGHSARYRILQREAKAD